MKRNSTFAAPCCALTFVFGLAARPARATNPYTQNGIFLNHGFVVDSMTDAQIISVVNWLSARQFKKQFLNVASFNANGTISAANYSQLAHWISVSRATDPSQQIIIYISGTKTMVNTSSTWTNIANACKMFFTTYAVDGVNLDFEPYQVASSNYVGLFSAVRTAVGSTANLSLDYTADAGYYWSGADFNTISQYFNYIMPMLYDSSAASVAAYKTFIDTALNFEYNYKVHACKIVPIIPVYATSATHNPSIENIQNSTNEIWKLAQTQGTVEISNIAVWWYYGWNGTTTDTQWNTYWLSR